MNIIRLTSLVINMELKKHMKTKTKTKTKIIVGSKEQLSVRTSGNLLNRLIPDSTIEILHGYRHGDLSLNHPEQYAMLLKERLYSQKADATHL